MFRFQSPTKMSHKFQDILTTFKWIMYIKPPQIFRQISPFLSTPKGKAWCFGFFTLFVFLFGYWCAPKSPALFPLETWSEALIQMTHMDAEKQSRLLEKLQPYEESAFSQKLSYALLFRSGRFQMLLEKLIRQEERDPYEQYLLGILCLEILRDQEQATLAFQKILEDDSLYSLLGRAYLAYFQQKTQEALALLQEGRFQKEPELLWLKGRLEPEQKYEYFQQGVLTDPTHLFLRLEFAYVALQKQATLEISFLLPPFEFVSEIPFASLVFGYASERKEAWALAESYYQKALLMDSAEAFFRYANFLAKQKREKEALTYLEKAIQKKPSLEKFLLRGQLYQQQDQNIEAIESFEQALKLAPNHPETLLFLASIQYKLKNYKEAQQRAETVLTLKSKSKEALKILTLSAFYQKNWELVLKTAEQWIIYDPEGYRWRAEVYFQQKEHLRVIEDCSRLLQKHPSEAQAYFLRGQSYFLLKDYKPAFSDLQKVRVLNPEEYRVLFYLARIQELQKNYGQALEMMEELLTYSPEHPEYLLYRGELYTYQTPEKAIADFSHFIKIKPEDPRGYFKRALLQLSLQNYSLAKKDLDWLIEKYPEEAEYYYQRGKLHVATEQPQLAHEDFNRCLQFNSTHSNALTAQGMLYFQEKKFEESFEPLSLVKPQDENYQVSQSFLLRAKRFAQTMKYLKEGPKTGNEAYEIGVYYLDSQQEDEATNAFKQALQLDSNFFYAHIELARIYAKRKQEGSAFKELETAIKLGYRNTDELKMDISFALLRNLPKFKELLEQIESLEKNPPKKNNKEK